MQFQTILCDDEYPYVNEKTLIQRHDILCERSLACI